MIIDPTNPIVDETSYQYWKDELINTRILLNNVDLAINALTVGNHASYQLDSGQTSQRVTRLDLDSLYKIREDLLSQIHDLEIKCGVNGHGVVIARPGW